MVGPRACIWIVEDDPDIVELITHFLGREGFSVRSFARGQALLSAITEGLPDLFLIDLTLPDLDGIELTRRVRASCDRPVILVTGRGAVKDRVTGLDAGADDYIVKPFDLAELSARIRSNLRRTEASGSSLPDEQRLDGFTLNSLVGTLSFKDNTIDLTEKEAAILGYLANNPNRVIPRDEMYLYLSGRNWDGVDRSLDVYLCRIRNKMHGLNPRYNGIKTIRGVGYKLTK